MLEVGELITNPFCNNLPVVNLRPGELYVAWEPTIIMTILGSCVAVCLYSSQKKVGAMCHGVMPTKGVDQEDCSRFVDCAIHYMVGKIGSPSDGRCMDLQAKLFGGADVINYGIREFGRAIRVGLQNIEIAKHLLVEFEIPLIAEQVGGRQGQKMYFCTSTGEVLMKYLAKSRPLE